MFTLLEPKAYLSSPSYSLAKDLNFLASLCRESSKRYALATELVSSSELRSIFQKEEQERARFSEELKRCLTNAAQDLISSNVPNEPVLCWTTLISETSTDKGILEYCIDGENHVLDIYAYHLSKSLPLYVSKTLNEQHSLIEQSKFTLLTYINKLS